MERFDFRSYRERKKKWRLRSLIVGGIGIFIILDSWTLFPIPLYGVLAWYIGGALLIPSVIVFIWANQPPTDRMVSQLAAKLNGYVLATILMSEFDISTEVAEDIMKRLFLEGYLDIVNKVDDNTPISQWVTIFVGAGQTSSNPQSAQPRSQDMDIRAHTAENDEITVADINNMLLNGGLHLGGSGQPR